MLAIPIQDATIMNKEYKRVIYTSPTGIQISLSRLLPEEEIKETTDANLFIRVESGKAVVTSKENTLFVTDGDGIIVPGNTSYTLINIGKDNLHLHTISATTVIANAATTVIANARDINP